VDLNVSLVFGLNYHEKKISFLWDEGLFNA